MKIISWNVNGIRAVERKGELQSLIENQQPDILFLQETKAKAEQLSKYLTSNDDYIQHYHSAEKAGYSGVAVWIKKTVKKDKVEIIAGMPGWNDYEGRVIRADIDKNTFIGAYFPNGGKSESAWLDKLKFYDHFLKYVNGIKNNGMVVWCGDLNVAHNEIDLARAKENEGNIGFRPEERSWVDRVIQADWVDLFRKIYPEKISYTWWNVVTRARERDVGWRIDYFFTHKSYMNKVLDITHLSKQMGSDHCPVMLETTELVK